MRAFLRKLRWLTQRRDKEAELREELQFHLDEEAEERQGAGLTAEDARWAARRDLGNLTLVEENTRAAWGWTILEQLGQDLRYACRTMAANPVFSMLAVSSLALGIGANTAIYSFMDAILLRSLPVAAPESLVVLNWHTRSDRDSVMKGMSGRTYDEESGVTAGIFPFPVFELLRQNDNLFSAVFAHCQYRDVRSMNVALGGQADLAVGWNVSGDYFRGLGIGAAAGRLIVADDDRAGAAPVAVISHRFGQKHFSNVRDAVGRTIRLNGLPFTVVGVTPPEFFGVDPAAAPDIYLPLHVIEAFGAGQQFGFRPEDWLAPNYYWIQIMARLRPGVTLAQAQAALAPAFRHWVADTAANDAERANLPELIVKEGASGLDSLRRQYSHALWLLMALVGSILILACANVANLLLARGTARRREMAMRLSIGAGRSRIIRQLLTESVLLSSLGGALGMVFAIWGVRFLTLLLANGRADFTLRADLNWHVLGVAAGLSVLTGVVFGLAPALNATRVDVVTALKDIRTSPKSSRSAFRLIGASRLLVIAQVAISLLLLFTAGLFVRTLSNLHAVELGFNRHDLLLFQVDARKAGHKDPEISAFYNDLRMRFSAIPGVRHTSLAEDSLIDAGHGLPISAAGMPPDPATSLLIVGPQFFTTMQIPLLAGRDFDERDRVGSPAVAVINEVFAARTFGNRNPLGQRLTLWEPGEPRRVGRDMEIVGVSGNTRYGGLTRDIPPVVYMPYDQGFPQPEQMVFALRTAGDPLGYVNAVRDIVRHADAGVPVSDVRTQTADIDQTINQEITFARLSTAFAILALVIASVGLYGTVSQTVASRTGEIGIRVALGAPRRRIIWMVLREMSVLTALGLAVGLGAALGALRFVASFLYEVKPDDPVSLLLPLTIFVSAALLAGYVPARRAARIDPMIAIRED